MEIDQQGDMAFVTVETITIDRDKCFTERDNKKKLIEDWMCTQVKETKTLGWEP